MPLETGLAGKRALVTGGPRDIGYSIASPLAYEGVALAIADVDPAPEAITSLSALSGWTFGVQADVSQEAEAVRKVEEAASSLGGVDLYINNAGAIWHEPVTRMTVESFLRTIYTNLAACLWACCEWAGS